ncbi:hypothetical protein ES150_21070 [Enterobacillus tribolii]|nr:hypothetical protein [Enterobacillus tribolii]
MVLDNLVSFLLAQRVRAIALVIVLLSISLIIYCANTLIIDISQNNIENDINNIYPQQKLILPLSRVTNAPAQRKETHVVTKSAQVINIQVTGIIYSNEVKGSRAILKNERSQRSYATEEPIEGYENVFLQKIDPDKVTVNNNGQLQILALTEKKSSTSSSDESLIQPNSENQSISLENYIFPAIVYSESHIPNGIRLNNKVSPAVFRAAGLIPGDIAIKINNHIIENIEQANEALNEIKQLRTIEFTLLRNGQPILATVSAQDFINNTDAKKQ